MKEAMKLTVDGWLETSGDVARDLRDLHSVRSNLLVVERLLVYNGRIVIPNALQSKILEIIHHGHQRITKCNESAKEAVWWFGIGIYHTMSSLYYPQTTIQWIGRECGENSHDRGIYWL